MGEEEVSGQAKSPMSTWFSHWVLLKAVPVSVRSVSKVTLAAERLVSVGRAPEHEVKSMWKGSAGALRPQSMLEPGQSIVAGCTLFKRRMDLLVASSEIACL